MGVGALIAGSIGSSVIGGISAKKSADAQADAAAKADDTQRYIYDKNFAAQEPWRQSGQNALDVLNSDMGLGQNVYRTDNGKAMRAAEFDGKFGFEALNKGGEWAQLDRTFDNQADQANYLDQYKVGFETSPGYEFRQSEGQNALAKMAAARGIRLSGATMKDSIAYSDGLASQEYGNWRNALQSMAGVGQSAVNTQASLGQNFANASGQNALAAGQAKASGYQGINNAIQGGLNNAGSIYGYAQSGMFGANPGFGITPSPTGVANYGFS